MTTTATPGPLAPVATSGAREVAAPLGAPAAAALAPPRDRGRRAARRAADREALPPPRCSCSARARHCRRAALAMRLFPVTGAPGATLLRLALAAAMLLVLARPRVRGWRPSQWRAVALYGISLAGTNGFFYAALARLPLGTAVTIQFLGPLTLAAALSKRWRDAGWVGLAVAGVLILGLSSGHGTAGHPLNPAGVGVRADLRRVLGAVHRGGLAAEQGRPRPRRPGRGAGASARSCCCRSARTAPGRSPAGRT